MPPQIRPVPIKGITSFFLVVSGVDVALGPTLPDGAETRYGGTNLDSQSGQSTMPIASEPVSRTIQVVGKFLAGDLLLKRVALGLPASSLTGDHNAGTPTAEVLTVQQALMGTRADKLKLVSPGPRGPRTKVYELAKAQPNVTELNSRDQNIGFEITWTVLDPQNGQPVEIDTDAP